MPGFPVPFLKFREDTANGFPLAGGQLWSYAAGTGTPLPTYTTSALDVPNSNPVILDASGRAAIFIEDGVGYKFILADALGNTVWTVDDVQVPKILTPEPTTAVPTGAIVAYGGLTAPNGWLLCDGAMYSQLDYPALYLVILGNFGTAGSTFRVPDLQQRFPMGKAATGLGAAVGELGGEINHVHTGAVHKHTIPAHQHTIPNHKHTVLRAWTPIESIDQGVVAAGTLLVAGGPGVGSGGGTSPKEDQVSQLNEPDPLTSNNNTAALETNDGGAANTGTANPPYVVVNFIIKT